MLFLDCQGGCDKGLVMLGSRRVRIESAMVVWRYCHAESDPVILGACLSLSIDSASSVAWLLGSLRVFVHWAFDRKI